MRICLDTSGYSAFKRGDEKNTLDPVSTKDADQLALAIAGSWRLRW